MSTNNSSSDLSLTEWVPTNASISERLFIGFLYFWTAIIFIFLQCSILIVFLTHKEFRQHLCYRIMIVIAIGDISQLIPHVYGGIITIFNDSFNPLLEMIMGAVLNSMVNTACPLGFVLALNRMLVFLPKQWKMNEAREGALMKWLIGISLLQGILFIPFQMLPNFSFGFREYRWMYLNLSNTDFQWVVDFGNYQPYPYLVLTLLIYLFTIGLMLKQRRKLLPSSQQKIYPNSTAPETHNNNNNNNNQWASHERRLLAQALVQFLVEFSISFLWYLETSGPDIGLPIGTLQWSIFMNWYWIFFNGFKAVIYIVINRTIRRRVLGLWKLQIENHSAFWSWIKPKTVIVRNATVVVGGGECSHFNERR